jgi:hypothetical protein
MELGLTGFGNRTRAEKRWTLPLGGGISAKIRTWFQSIAVCPIEKRLIID